MLLKKAYLWVIAAALFLSTEISSQTYITPMMGMELITVKKDKYFLPFPNYLYDSFFDKPIPTAAAGFDAEKKIKDKLLLHFGITYLSFDTGKGYHPTSWGPDPFIKFTFKNLSNNLGVIYQVIPNLGTGMAFNLDYIFEFKYEYGVPGSPTYVTNYPSLLDLGINLNLRYRWRNWVLKVDYKYRLYEFKDPSEDTPPELQAPINIFKGFGVYAGYRFEL